MPEFIGQIMRAIYSELSFSTGFCSFLYEKINEMITVYWLYKALS